MTPVTVSMQDFLRTGEFGPVRLGLTRDQLRGYLGAPEDWGPTPKAERYAQIWKYGDIEFHSHFKEDALVSLFADHVGTLRGGRAIDLDPWVLNGDALVGQVLKSLTLAQIPYQRIPWALDDDTERYLVGAGVELLFWDETKHLFCAEGVSSLARPGMRFHGFSYRGR